MADHARSLHALAQFFVANFFTRSCPPVTQAEFCFVQRVHFHALAVRAVFY